MILNDEERFMVEQEMPMKTIQLPASDEVIRTLRVGEPVLLNGVMVTGRDAAHKWMMETFIKKDQRAKRR